MTIEITSPEVEALIQECLRSGAFKNAEDVILHALRSSKLVGPTGTELIRALQAIPWRNIDIEPPRAPLPVRDVDFRWLGFLTPTYCRNCENSDRNRRSKDL